MYTNASVIYKSVQQPVLPLTLTPEVVHVDAWQQPLSLLIGQWAAAGVMSAAIKEPVAQFVGFEPFSEAVHPDAWARDLDRPPIRPQYLTTEQATLFWGLFTQVPLFSPSVDAWGWPLSLPLRFPPQLAGALQPSGHFVSLVIPLNGNITISLFGMGLGIGHAIMWSEVVTDTRQPVEKSSVVDAIAVVGG